MAVASKRWIISSGRCSASTKGEDRFRNFVWPKVWAVHDLDDTREHSFGTTYTPQKPLTKEARAKK
jgi:hypothetical protein